MDRKPRLQRIANSLRRTISAALACLFLGSSLAQALDYLVGNPAERVVRGPLTEMQEGGLRLAWPVKYGLFCIRGECLVFEGNPSHYGFNRSGEDSERDVSRREFKVGDIIEITLTDRDRISRISSCSL